MIVTKSWWDTVDALAAHVVGTHFSRHPQVRAEYLSRWRHSDQIWLRRTTLLFQLRYKDRTDRDLVFALIDENLGSDEFFIQKAIGWALREYSKTDSQAVQEYVSATRLAPLSKREALKWLRTH
jgi:3-methyladenine DNA glycosylase AlkD